MKSRLTLVLLTVMVLLAALSVGPLFGQDNDGHKKAEEARQRHTGTLMEIEGVVGVALGLDTNEKPGVLVLTKEPGVAGIPRKLDDDVPVRVMVTGEIFALHHCKGKHADAAECEQPPTPTSTPEATPDPGSGCTTSASHSRPACIGTSTGNEGLIEWNGSNYCTVGTLGARLTDGTNVFALSNAHIYALEGSELHPDTDLGNGRILQPGRPDLEAQGCGDQATFDDYTIGSLAYFKPLDYDGDNTIDAAIALTTTEMVGNSTPPDGYGTLKSTTVAPELNQKVQKYGRTSGLTHNGRVVGINATVDVGYDLGTATFVSQIIVQPGSFLQGGDSGAVLVVKGGSDNRKAMGLLFAGSPLIAIASPIDAVLDKMSAGLSGNSNLTIDGE